MGRIWVIILILISFISSCKNRQEEDINLKHLDYIAESINNDLGSIRSEMYNLANALQYKVSFDKEVSALPNEKYHYHPGEVLFMILIKNLQSAIYFPANKKITND